MSKKIKNTIEQEEGFTLIELLVVILVIGILAAIAIPVFLNQRKTANEAAVKSDLINAAKVFETELIANKGKSYPTVIPQSVKTSSGVTLSLPTGVAVDPNLEVSFVAKDSYQTNFTFSQNGPSFYISAPMTDIVRNASVHFKYQCLDSSGNTINRESNFGLTTKTTGASSFSLGFNCTTGTTLIKGSGVVFADSSQTYANTTQLRASHGEYALPDPNATVASDKSFCINGTHSNISGKNFKYDSLKGGFQEGSC